MSEAERFRYEGPRGEIIEGVVVGKIPAELMNVRTGERYPDAVRIRIRDDAGRIHTTVAMRPCTPTPEEAPMRTLNDYAEECRRAADRWYYDPLTGEALVMNKGERLMLIVSELSEAMEGERKGLMDDKLPHRRMAEVELADALIRIFDYAGHEGYDLEGAYREKLAFNATRADHSNTARAGAGGKKW